MWIRAPSSSATARAPAMSACPATTSPPSRSPSWGISQAQAVADAWGPSARPDRHLALPAHPADCRPDHRALPGRARRGVAYPGVHLPAARPAGTAPRAPSGDPTSCATGARRIPPTATAKARRASPPCCGGRRRRCSGWPRSPPRPWPTCSATASSFRPFAPWSPRRTWTTPGRCAAFWREGEPPAISNAELVAFSLEEDEGWRHHGPTVHAGRADSALEPSSRSRLVAI